LIESIKTMSKREEIQAEALAATVGKQKVGLALSMGVGKTYIGLQHMKQEVDKNPNQKFLVVAPKVSIFQSWKDDAAKFGLSELVPLMEFTTYISLPKKERDYTVVYLDECHSILNSHDFWLSTYFGKIVGLTGTPPRYKNSEKGMLVEKHCPIAYYYITDSAVEDQILNDYKIIVHCLSLDTRKNYKVTTKTGKQFYTSEKAYYDYWTDRIATASSPVQQKIFRIMRMKAMMEFGSKERYAKEIADGRKEKCIVFCNTTEQADKICEHSYHSKNADSDENLEAFKNGSINKLSCVLQLSEGVNIPNLKCGIILHAYSNERKSLQRIGRMMRLNPTECAVIHILMYNDTQDVQWVSEALKDLDQSKITYVEEMI
jgi:superfamily II DNA or RNA helicase